MNFEKLRSGRKGFTLTEIMIVVLIMGILLAIAVPQFLRARNRTKARGCQSNLKQIMGAKERWALDNNRGPTDTPAMGDLVQPGVYLKNTPVCPSGGVYTINSLDQVPTCNIGGNAADYDAHVLE